MNILAFVLSRKDDLPPKGFDIKLDLLKTSRADRVKRAVLDGELDGYIQAGTWWVRRSDLQDLVGPGHCTYDETDDCCYIPLTGSDPNARGSE